MNTVEFSLQSLDAALGDFAAAWTSGKAQPAARIGFENWGLMHKVLSPKRLEIISAMTGAGPLTIREIARRVGRDFKGVHSDAQLLLRAAVVDKDARGKLVFPYERIKVNFEIPAAA